MAINYRELIERSILNGVEDGICQLDFTSNGDSTRPRVHK